MKIVVALSLTAIMVLGGFAASEYRQRDLLTQQIDDYVRQNSQLLAQIENNSLQNVESGRALRSLQSQLNDRDNRITALSRQLESLQQQVDPDYQQIEARIRQQLSREVPASNSIASADPRVAILNQLSELDPATVGEIISLNGQYGEFLQSLNVDADRKEIIINALQNLIVEQNQLRLSLIQELQANPRPARGRELQQNLRELSSAEAQREALSYELTESELNAFDEFLQRRQDSFAVFGSTSLSTDGIINGPVFFEGDLNRVDAGQSRAIRILPANPGN